MIFVLLLLIAFLHPAAISTSHNVEPISVLKCFEYGVSSLNHVCFHAECYSQLWIIIYLFNVGSIFDVSATVMTQL